MKKVKCLTCSVLYSVNSKEFEKAKKTADKTTKIMKLICPSCKGDKASVVVIPPVYKRITGWVNNISLVIWDKLTDILAFTTVKGISIWNYWQYDLVGITRQLITYFVIFFSAYLVILYTPLKSYLIAIIAILIISALQSIQRR